MFIVATETVQKMAKQALEVQDACNPLPVSKLVSESMRYFLHGNDSQVEHGTKQSGCNPITVALLNKLLHLSEMTQSRSMCFDACATLAEGVDVEWELEGYTY